MSSGKSSCGKSDHGKRGHYGLQFARSNIWVCFAFVLVLRGERCIDCYILAMWVWSSFLLRLQGPLALTTITPHETKCCPEKGEANATNP